MNPIVLERRPGVGDPVPSRGVVFGVTDPVFEVQDDLSRLRELVEDLREREAGDA